jgi:uncharacterized protein (DUF2336 family)
VHPHVAEAGEELEASLTALVDAAVVPRSSSRRRSGDRRVEGPLIVAAARPDFSHRLYKTPRVGSCQAATLHV